MWSSTHLHRLNSPGVPHLCMEAAIQGYNVFDMSRQTSCEVTAYADGPLIVRGDPSTVSPMLAFACKGRRTIAVCRCGCSAIKPLCDGTHRRIGFEAEGYEGPAG